MSLNVSTNFKNALSSVYKDVCIVLELPDLNIPLIFSSLKLGRIPRYGDADIPKYASVTDFLYGDLVDVENSYDIISMDDSSTTLSQQFEPDKQASGSIPSFNLVLIDKNEIATQLITPGIYCNDILGQKAKLYYTFGNLAWPDDAVPILNGVIDSVSAGAGFVTLSIKGIDAIKKQTLFDVQTIEITNNLDTTTTHLLCEGNDYRKVIDAFNGSHTTIKRYIVIDNEAMLITGLGSGYIDVTRGQLGTLIDSHTSGTSGNLLYRIQGQAIYVLLEFLLSSGDLNWATYDVRSFVVDESYNIANAIYFDYFDIQQKFGLVKGDFVSVTGSSGGHNDVTNAVISGFDKTTTGRSYIILSGVSLVSESNTSATISFRSKYNVITNNTGLGLNPDFVDVEQFELVNTTFYSFMSTVDFYVKDSITAKDFLDKIAFESGLIPVFRKGKTSIIYTSQPISNGHVKVLDESNVLNPDKLVIQRNVNNNFYNCIEFLYEESPSSDKFLKKVFSVSTESVDRIKVGKRVLKIEAKSLKSSSNGTAIVESLSQRLLDRYQYACEYINLQTTLGDGFQIEIGDVVMFGSSFLKLSDITKGDREFEPRMFQVTNKSVNLKTGEVSITLLNTIFGISSRYGIMSPSSYVGPYSTSTVLRLKKGLASDEFEKEIVKWQDYVGERVFVHNPNYTQTGVTYIQSVSTQYDDTLNVSPALGFTPSDGYIVDIPNYSETEGVDAIYKNIYVYENPYTTVTSGVSSTQFNVATPSYFSVGKAIYIRSTDYATQSKEVKVTNIIGSTIYCGDLGFTPISGQVVEMIGFKDTLGYPAKFL